MTLLYDDTRLAIEADISRDDIFPQSRHAYWL